jgi:hypothetical protein
MIDTVEPLAVLCELPSRDNLAGRNVDFSIRFIGKASAESLFRLLAKGIPLGVVPRRVLQDVLALQYNEWLLDIPR